MIVPNVILNKGNSLQVEVKTTSVEETYENDLKVIALPNKDQQIVTSIVDLGRIVRRIMVDGYITGADSSKVKEAFRFKGSVPTEYDGETLVASLEKMSLNNEGRDDDSLRAKFTIVIGTTITEGDEVPV